MEFVLEDAVDGGGPSREFACLFANGIKDTYFEGQPDSRVLMHNSVALQVRKCILCTNSTVKLVYTVKSTSTYMCQNLLPCTQENTFFYIGRLMAMTVVNCSSGYPFLAPSVYSYLCGTPLSNIVIADDEVPTFEIRNLMEKVSTCNAIINTDCC